MELVAELPKVAAGKPNAWVTRFVVSAGAILAVTAVLKIVSAFGHAQVLGNVDPIFQISFRDLILFAGIIELMVSVICFLFTERTGVLWLVTWLSVNFAGYRTALWMVGYREPCHCMGTFTEAVGIPPHAADLIMKGVLGYLLIGSCVSHFWRRRKLISPGVLNA